MTTKRSVNNALNDARAILMAVADGHDEKMKPLAKEWLAQFKHTRYLSWWRRMHRDWLWVRRPDEWEKVSTKDTGRLALPHPESMRTEPFQVFVETWVHERDGYMVAREVLR